MAECELTRDLDDAVSRYRGPALAKVVKGLLMDAIRGRSFVLESALLAPCPDRYARRLLHCDPAARYSVVVMVWNLGQSTPLHDHAGLWCVECVYEGQVLVTSYDRVGEPEGEKYRFRPASFVRAGFGDAGALIPPFEYHTMENASFERAITLHVYGGEMSWCHVYLPTANGLHYRERRLLSYTP
jgi:3-mercaptopropionate dioxygenase